MHFGITEKPTMDCVSPYNSAGLISKVSEEIGSENAENCRCRQPHCRFKPPPQETSANISINLISPETIVLAYIFVADSGPSFKFFVVGSERRIFSAIECVSAVQGHLKILAPIERAYAIYFLLVINSNLQTLVLSCIPFLRYSDLFAENCELFLPCSHLTP